MTSTLLSLLLRYRLFTYVTWQAAHGTESNGKLPHLLIPSKTATLVPELAVEDLPLGRTATFVSEFVVKDLPLRRTLMMIKLLEIRYYSFVHSTCARTYNWCEKVGGSCLVPR